MSDSFFDLVFKDEFRAEPIEYLVSFEPRKGPVPEVWYRMFDGLAGGSGDARVLVSVHSFGVTRRTEKGVWLEFGLKGRFVRNDSVKKFAYPTVEEARISFMARKTKQIRIMNARLNHAERALRLMEKVGSLGVAQ